MLRTGPGISPQLVDGHRVDRMTVEELEPDALAIIVRLAGMVSIGVASWVPLGMRAAVARHAVLHDEFTLVCSRSHCTQAKIWARAGLI